MKKKKISKGLTLVELLMVVALMSVLVVVTSFVFVAVFKSWGFEIAKAQVKQEAGWGIEKMDRELKELLLITAAEQYSIVFWSDVNENGVQDANESITYSWSGTPGDNLTRNDGSVTSALSNDVQSFQLSYYNGSGNPLVFPVTPANIRLITINLATKKEDETITIRSNVRPRNL
ncbi:MAG: prepilin-type N-terminal cleavage/methylation domain-containing protein [Candidatus Auribacterota bacterium]|nr:prepilin-type N-terminal cleavage/methylation domain-containing protein [Candidatus Auribacterota bacterium]